MARFVVHLLAKANVDVFIAVETEGPLGAVRKAEKTMAASPSRWQVGHVDPDSVEAESVEKGS